MSARNNNRPWLQVVGLPNKNKRTTAPPDAPDSFVGGTATTVFTAKRYQFPEMVVVQTASANCHGALISTKAILTAASCFWTLETGLSTDEVMIGVGALSGTSVNASITVFNVTIHPQYRYYPLSGVHENNIAIILLQRNLVVDGRLVAPINLTASSTAKPDSYLKIPDLRLAGWGQTQNNANVSDPLNIDSLLFATVYMAPQKSCAAAYASLNSSKVYLLSDTMICTNVTTSLASTCKGDTGAPLRYINSAGAFPYTVMVGIATEPIETRCPTSLPSLYTNIAPFIKWIASVTGLSLK
ncbi:fibrinolytic enzyme, isozyme C-like [Neocloeon triangulifer]|uniref:fibrinolytic enzyme, isozyme C-like n=1 Tax=Neocloeon triangulifer TaxID=2078957 RepID=UPI00286F5B59|nr:fibrinolytic enzyme, isozyme C-like [Neocloeon triangulifer]